MAGLLVIGDVVTDVVARHRSPVAPGTDTEADIVLRPGGSGANTAAWAAHLGADARLLARAGYDTGSWHVGELTRAGVTTHVRIDPGSPTAVVIAMVDATGERTMLTTRGAGRRIGPGDWDDALLDGVGRMHVSGYTMFAPPGLELVRLATRAALDRGAAVSVDPASTGFLREFGPERFLRETSGATLVVPNLDEALLLTGAPGAATAAEALSVRYGTAIVKLGADGALLAVSGRVTRHVPGRPGGETVDSTGAGDAFAAGVLTAFLGGAADHEAVEAGCRAGAAAVTRLGGRPVAALAGEPSHGG